ncbi:endonuclease domain-containing protein [Fluviicola sp.]|uniref:endonuclease domain-containing protein n=1 Tax=Fluviicola sp. TaxID=1917219 RepID=UPI00263755E1|nr:endonuclease domain-containing protein [Fluviicola sp.]
MKLYHHHYYNPKLKEYARELRTETISKAEKYIWKGLLSRKQTGERFLRQRSVYNFIVDFFAPEIGLIIEIDGNSHTNKGDYDRYREDKLISLGYTIIRFSEGDVLNNLDLISEQIRHVIHALRSATLLDPPSREEA